VTAFPLQASQSIELKNSSQRNSIRGFYSIIKLIDGNQVLFHSGDTPFSNGNA